MENPASIVLTVSNPFQDTLHAKVHTRVEMQSTRSVAKGSKFIRYFVMLNCNTDKTKLSYWVPFDII